MLCSGPINNLCFLLTFINILKYFNVTRLPLFTPISLTNSGNVWVFYEVFWLDMEFCHDNSIGSWIWWIGGIPQAIFFPLSSKPFVKGFLPCKLLCYTLRNRWFLSLLFVLITFSMNITHPKVEIILPKQVFKAMRTTEVGVATFSLTLLNKMKIN